MKEAADAQRMTACADNPQQVTPGAMESNSINTPIASGAVENKIFLITWQGNPVSTNFVCDDKDVHALLCSWCQTRSLSLVTVNTIDWNARSIVFLAGREGYSDCLFEFRFAELKRFGKD